MQPSLVRLFMWYGEGRRLFALCGGGAAGVLLLPVAALVFVEPYADEGRDDEGDGEADEPSDVEHGAEGVEGGDAARWSPPRCGYAAGNQ